MSDSGLMLGAGYTGGQIRSLERLTHDEEANEFAGIQLGHTREVTVPAMYMRLGIVKNYVAPEILNHTRISRYGSRPNLLVPIWNLVSSQAA